MPKRADRAAKGAWVELHRIVLEPGARAPHLPDETRRVPLELRVKGFLVRAAALGEQAEIETPAGRRQRGTLVAIEPAYEHGFGPPVPELLDAGRELRARLRRERGT